MEAQLFKVFASALTFCSFSFIICAQEVDNGTDPTRISTAAFAQYKHTDLPNVGNVGLFELQYLTPLGKDKSMSLAVKLPIASGVQNSDCGIGDASVSFTHIASLNQHRGLMYQTELIFDTADRLELGFGQTVLKLTGFYAKFLKNGAAFGGHSQVYVRPQVLMGNERPANWSFQIGYKVIGF